VSLECRDALLEPIETGKRECRNTADNRRDRPKGHRCVLQQHRCADQNGRDPTGRH
jgi:hypothetical protein